MLDGIFFYKLANELNNLSTGKIDKVQEVSEYEFLFTIRKMRVNYKLLISLSPNYPRVNITNGTYSFPREPKSFTMLLRKYFEGAIVDYIQSHETDRIMEIRTSRYNELGDFERISLIIEIMGRYSNLIIVKDDTIIEALRHIGISEMRSVLPNGAYEYPDTLGKINPFTLNEDELNDILSHVTTPKELTNKILGLSYNAALRVFDGNVKTNFIKLINENNPNITSDFKEVNYYLTDGAKTYDSYSEALDEFYSKVSLKDRIKSKTSNISSFIDKLITKNKKKIVKLDEDIDKAKRADIYKLYGELLIANAYIDKKLDKINVLNYYTNEEITIPLDNKLYIKENANNYFKKYKKSKNTIIYAEKEKEIANDEIEYFTLLKTQIETAETLDDALEIQDELIKEKYLNIQTKTNKKSKPKILTYEYNGSLIYVGKNNIQNEMVTFDLAKKDSLWFHVKDAPGSHVVLQKSDGYTEDDIRLCANIAALFSNLKDSSSVPVNYTKVRNIKTIPGKRKCFVSIKGEKTIYIDPDNQILSNLTIKK